jgi:hypothetical protein
MDHESSSGETKGLFRRRWRTLALEIAAIFIGITASFVVDEWREEHQDTQTFHRILGEIYYDVRIDESILVGSAASNNASLLLASDLALRDSAMPPAEELFQQLEAIFADNVMTQPTLAGTRRLENTPLSIPVNDVQLSLDNGYGLYIAGVDNIALQMARLRDLRSELWWQAGGVPCTPSVNVSLTPHEVETLDLNGQIQPVVDATHDGDRCLPSPDNQRAALRAVHDEAFLTGLRQVIRVRQNIAVALLSARATVHRLRGTLETYLPDIHLPVQTLGIVGDATTAGWDPALAVKMRRVTTHAWEVETRLSDGEVKFAANREWTMNWGAPRPWVARRSYMSFDEQVDVAEVFPSGTAVFNGLNIPVESGRYRVRLNTRSGEYSFERLSD